MPWPKGDVVLLRAEFSSLALRGANIKQLCQQFQISRKTGYKWIHRAEQSTEANFEDQPKQPHHIHYIISNEIKEKIITTRCLYPHWGAKKIKAYWLNHKESVKLPSLGTINKILFNEGLMLIHKNQRHTAYKRFEYAHPNELWQMDFKGYFSLSDGSFCHPLTLIDDHSRYLLELQACPNENFITVKEALIVLFTRYGLPDAIALDNGGCWSPKSKQHWSELTVWFMRLGIKVIHGKPYHPQSQGKDERLHRTLKMELLSETSMKNLSDAQNKFDQWRYQYNYIRPHEALDLKPPATRYQISQRHFKKELLPIQYLEGDIIRHLDVNGILHVDARNISLSKALRNQPVALRPSQDGKKLNIFFCQELIKSIKHPGGPIHQGRGGVTHAPV